MTNTYTSILNKCFKPVPNGNCKLGISGDIAIKTTSGYKIFDKSKNALVSCENFVLDIDSNMFIYIPTTSVKVGDIIISNGSAIYVTEVSGNKFVGINYETGVIEDIVLEKHIMFGNQFYLKIGSMLNILSGNKVDSDIFKNDSLKNIFMLQAMSGNSQMFGGNSSLLPLMLMNDGLGGDNSDMSNILKMQMLSSMFGGNSSMNPIMAMMLMNGSGNFLDIFNKNNSSEKSDK